MNKPITLYHGSDHIVRTPVFGAGSPHNDYGLGFYCTESLELAKEWACKSPSLGMANRYDFDPAGFSVMDLTSKQYNILNWLAILLENRSFDAKGPLPAQSRAYIVDNFLPPYQDADVIKGYRADDSYFAYARDFVNNTISLGQLSRAMNLGNLGVQIVLKSKAAVESLRFVDAETADGGIYFPKRQARDSAARSAYFSLRTDPASPDAVFAIDILRQKLTNDSPLLR